MRFHLSCKSVKINISEIKRKLFQFNGKLPKRPIVFQGKKFEVTRLFFSNVHIGLPPPLSRAWSRVLVTDIQQLHGEFELLKSFPIVNEEKASLFKHND